MIWRVQRIDQLLIDAFENAGEPDQRVISAYLRKTHKPMHPPKHDGIRRWYYLLAENRRIRLATTGRPLAEWRGEAKVLVGTNEIIGEFAGNRKLVGQRGLQLKCEPIEWLQGEADLVLADGAALLAEISEQILDGKAIDRSQRNIARRYEWK